jgi:uncharacterized protein involved in outer membrane biogenesis
MQHLATKFRPILRAVLLAVTIIAVSVATLAAALPYLIDGKAVRATLARSLSAWSGGPVIIDGPVKVANIATLSIKASKIRFAASPRLSPAARLEAKSITVAAHFPSLLRGRLEFRYVTLDEPKIYLTRKRTEPAPAMSAIEVAKLAARAAERNVFEHLDLQNATLIQADGEHAPYRRIALQRVRLDRAVPRDGTPSQPSSGIYLKQDGLEFFFRGTLDQAGENAQGNLRLAAPAGHPAATLFLRKFTPWERTSGFSISGDFTWSGARASLENASLTSGGHRAKGSLALALRRGRPLLEGTLAYDRLDLPNAEQDRDAEGGVGGNPLEGLEALRARLDPDLDLDIRLSAERMTVGTAGEGPFAVALTSRSGHVTADVAELTAFGGNITGRVEYDAAHPASLSLSANGSRLDATALAAAFGLPFAVNGSASINLALTVPIPGNDAGHGSRAASGTFSVGFPSGGSLDGDVSRQLSQALERRDLFWGLGSSSFPFSEAQIDGTVSASGVALKIDGEHNGKRIAGLLRIAPKSDAVSGSLALSDIEEASGAGAAPTAGASKPESLLLSGTVAALNISPAGKTSLSN